MGSFTAENYEFQLYLEGVLIEFNSISISTSGYGSSATIELPPSQELFDIKPRTLVQVFFKKHSEKDFKMLFDGEVIGLSANKSHAFSGISLQCRDISSYLESMYIYLTGISDPVLTDAYVVKHFGAAETTPEIMTESPIVDKTLQILCEEAQTQKLSIIGVIDKIMFKLMAANDFFKMIQDNHKYLERFYSVNDQAAAAIFQTQFLALLTSNTQRYGMDTLRSLIDTYLGMSFYEMSFNPAPAFQGSPLSELIYKPDNFAFPAPKCNIIFPNMTSGYSLSRNFMQEPTRLMIRTADSLSSPTDDQDSARALSYISYAPAELEQIKDAKPALHNQLIGEEPYKGIIPMYLPSYPQGVLLQQVDFGKMGTSNANQEPGLKVINYATEYLYQKMQYQNRRVQTSSGTFNPSLVVNFPGAIIINPYIIFGVIRSITHSISAQGEISTNMQMDHCRIVPIVENKITKDAIAKLGNTKLNANSTSMTPEQTQLARLKGEIEYAYPVWLNEAYKPSSISETYSKMFGCLSIMSEVSSDPSTTAQSDALRSSYNKYLSYESRGLANEYTDICTSRNIITKSQFYSEFLGIGTENGGMYKAVAGGYFLPERQNVILSYKKSYNGSAGLVTT